MEKLAKRINILNDLIQVNFDRIASYKWAVGEIKKDSESYIDEAHLEKVIQDSENNVRELTRLIQKLGGSPQNSLSFGSKMQRIWIDVKSTFNIETQENILRCCIVGDNTAIKAYKTTLLNTESGFPNYVLDIFNKQMNLINTAQNANTSLKSALEKVLD